MHIKWPKTPLMYKKCQTNPESLQNLTRQSYSSMLPLLRNSRGAAYIVSHSKVARSLSEPQAFLREAPVCKKLTPKLVPIRSKKLLQHVGAMSWHHAKFHDFQACFGFTWIKKPSFSIFPAEPRCLDVWISFPFLAWDLEIYPRTHMWFFNQLWCTGACACI